MLGLHVVISGFLDRLRPLRSAFHDSWGSPAPCLDGIHQETIAQIVEWMNESSENDDHPMVFWLFGNSRPETTAIAQSVAIWAKSENRLASSFFFRWSGNQDERNPADLIPSVMYKFAQYDPDVLRRVAESIIACPDVRDQGTTTQISLLLEKPFSDISDIMSLDLPLLVVIDALDTCNDLTDPQIARAIVLFIRTLTSKPLQIKILIISRLPRAIRHIIDDPVFPACYELVLPHHAAADYSWTISTEHLLETNDGVL
jgi:hypothetical protein